MKGMASMTRALAVLISVICLSGAVRAENAVPGEYVVKLKQTLQTKSMDRISTFLRADVVDVVRDDVVLVRDQAGQGPQLMLQILQENPMVELVEPNYIYNIVRVPNDPDFGKLWGLKNTGDADSSGSRGVKSIDVNAEKAWDLSIGSRDIVVAVIDTGVDYTHPDLAPNAWVNEAEMKGKSGVDDDGNGYIDDIHGYDFANNDGDSMDDHGHGSHCSGTIGGSGNDGRGVVGVNWQVRIAGVKFLTKEGSGTLANAVKSIDYATKIGANIMSNSWGGGGFSQVLMDAIVRARAAGILFTAAAGNESNNNDRRPSYPASYDVDNIISVAAINNRGALAPFSSYGLKSVHIAAPGVNVLSTVPGGQDTYSGTSMATPHVSGVAALLMAYAPTLKYNEIKERLLKTARPLSSLKGKVATGGMVDAYYALSNTMPPADANDPSSWTNKIAQAVSSPHPYPANYRQTYTLTAKGAKRVAIHFTKFNFESGYDKVEFFNAAGESIGSLSGAHDDTFSPIADGESIMLKVTSDKDVNEYGFDIDQIVFE